MPEYSLTNYGGDSDWKDDRSPGSWGAAGHDDDKDANTYWDWVHEMKKSKDEEERCQDKGKEKDPDDDGPKLEEHDRTCCTTCRKNIHYLFDAVDNIMQALQSLDQKDYNFKFLKRNVRKLFEVCSNMRKSRLMAKEAATILCASSAGSVTTCGRGGGDCRSYEFLDLVWSSRVV
uniref:Uncharacterized protein n=1 Tax=Setaria viridis TaxID=4556 RepID=A0A4U6TEH8_SETVI|nr:hypothetical protein SEVIR_8G121400v2 [Setaria viridis]